MSINPNNSNKMELCILELRKAIIAYEECKYENLDRKDAVRTLQRRCIDLEEAAKRFLNNPFVK